VPNLRIIYQNQVDLSTTTITSSSNQTASTTVSNLRTDTKSLVWRTVPTTSSGTQVYGNLIVDLGSTKTVGGVVLAFTNLNSNTATIRVRGYATAPIHAGDLVNTPDVLGTSIYDTGNVQCCPWNSLSLPSWGTNPVNSSNYSYGGGTYARVWFPSSSAIGVRYLSIQIIDNYATSGVGRFIEVSRLIIGSYWSPKYNTSFGMTSGIKDLSEHIRTESGDLLTVRGPRYQSLSFDMNWLDTSDRIDMTKILLGNGMSRPVLVSLFPDETTTSGFERERSHQIYGKIVEVPGISYIHPDIYSVALEIEEV
jgi:hypothetical protein